MDFEIKIKEKFYINKHDKKKITALKNINIKINSNEFICIVGPSGCGKTTLMNMIGGLISSNDQIIFANKNNKKHKHKDFGYVFQSSRLLPWLTIKENIELVTEESFDDYAKIENLLSNFGLKDFANYYPKSISGGMRRKVSLARALVNEPKVLLMDEPFISLDQPTSRNLYNVLLEYWHKNPITIIFITHNLKEAILLGERIVFFSKRPGTVVFDYKIKSRTAHKFNIDNQEVDNEYSKLIKKYPKLLDGVL